MGHTPNRYCPWKHAERVGVPIVYTSLPGAMVAGYSCETETIYIRPGLRETVERCALAHELVHWEHGDSGTAKEESRADRIAANRLINPDELRVVMADTNDLQQVARELKVTIKLLTIYLTHNQGAHVQLLAG